MQLLFPGRLIEPLAKDQLTSAQKRNYFIFNLIAFAVVPALRHQSPSHAAHVLGLSPAVFHWSRLACGVVITILTTYVAWRANGGHKGRNFVERFITLFVPITIQMILVFSVLTVLVVGFVSASGGGHWANDTLFWTVIGLYILAAAYLYGRLIECLIRVHRADPQTGASR